MGIRIAHRALTRIPAWLAPAPRSRGWPSQATKSRVIGLRRVADRLTPGPSTSDTPRDAVTSLFRAIYQGNGAAARACFNAEVPTNLKAIQERFLLSLDAFIKAKRRQFDRVEILRCGTLGPFALAVARGKTPGVGLFLLKKGKDWRIAALGEDLVVRTDAGPLAGLRLKIVTPTEAVRQRIQRACGDPKKAVVILALGRRFTKANVDGIEQMLAKMGLASHFVIRE